MKVYVLKYSTVGWVIALFIFIIAFWGVRYNSDWEGYSYFYTHSDQSPDIAFGMLSDIFVGYDFEYYYLYRSHIIVMSLAFLFFTSKFTDRYLFIVLTILLFSYVTFGNQIRYYVAFPLALLAVYYLFVKKKFILHFMFATLAILNHSAIIVFFLCFYLILLLYNYFSKYLVLLATLVNIICLFVFKILKGYISGHFDAYFETEQESSLLGGLYSIFQCVLILFCIYCMIKSLKLRASSILKDRKFIFLYLLSFCTSFFLILPSFTMQIINNRYITPLITVWIIFFLYIKDNEKNARIKRLCNIYIFIIIFIRVIWVYILPILLFHENIYTIESLVMLNSYEM